MSPFDFPEAPYTIDKIMKAIQAQIIDPPQSPASEVSSSARRVDEAGGTTPEAHPIPTSALVSDGTPRSQLLSQLELLRQRQGLTPPYQIRSHRPIVGGFLDLIKRLIHWGSQPYVDAVRKRQEAFNDATLQTLREVAKELAGAARRDVALDQSLNGTKDAILECAEQMRCYLEDLITEKQQYLEELTEKTKRSLLDNTEKAKKEAHQSLQESQHYLETLVDQTKESLLDNTNKAKREAQQGLQDKQHYLEDLIDQTKESLLDNTDKAKREAQQGLQDKQHYLEDLIDQTKESLLDNTNKAKDELYQSLEDLNRKKDLLFSEFERTVGQLRGAIAEEMAERRKTDLMLESRARSLEHRYELASFFKAVPAEKRLAILDATRGPYEDIYVRQSIYVQEFDGVPGQVLDVGCGRGELLNQLRNEGFECWGAEIDPLMIEICRHNGEHVVDMDAIAALRSVQPASLGGVFAAQVVEHLFPGELLTFLRLARTRLAQGGRMILETLNPASVGVLIKSYFRDIDHKQPVHPEYLKLLTTLAGFERVELHYLSPFEEKERLPNLPTAKKLGITDQAREELQQRFDQLNELLYGMQDYYILAEQGDPLSPEEVTELEEAPVDE